MNDVNRTMLLPATAMALIHRHFETLRGTAMPISIRQQVQFLQGSLGSASISREDLIRAVEHCAVECGFSVHFDAHLGDEPDIAA